MTRAHLVLADGTVFEGRAIGAAGTTVGEAVFTTGMTGYQEVLTDPSFAGQIVCMTAPAQGDALVGRVLRNRANGLPRTLAPATVSRPSARTAFVRFAQSAIGPPS